MKNGSDSPRKIALLILNSYFKERKSLKDIINRCFSHYNLSGLNRRFIFNVVKGTVRYYIRLDFIISLFSDKDIKDIDFKVLNILRMGIFQCIYMDKVPAYSAVDQSVELTKSNATLSSTGFVNAILRRVCSVEDMDLFIRKKAGELIEDEIDGISINYSYPRWLVKYWFDWYGKERTVLLCKSLNENPHVYLRFNKGKTTKNKLSQELDTVLPCKNILLEDIRADAIEVSSAKDINKTGAYKKGLVSVQDLSSQIAVKYYLDPGKGEKVLDICAAPGGKTVFISEMVGVKGEVLSVDISGKRLKLMKDNLERLNADNVWVMQADAAEKNFLEKNSYAVKNKNFKNKKISGDYTGYFDKIIIDAPCSAFGTISKNPDVKYNKTMDDVIRLSGLSYRMMVNCGRYLKPGGKLVFYTCTISPLENQQVISKFLKEYRKEYAAKNPNMTDELISILKIPSLSPNKDSAALGEEACFEIMPYYFGSEAGFVCSFIKSL